MTTVKEIELTMERDRLRGELETTNKKLAAFERREEAEAFLCSIMQDPRAPLTFKPSTPSDFLDKRAQLEGLDNIKAAEVAVKMAQFGGFEIGEVMDDGRPPPPNDGSKADMDFNDYLLAADSGMITL